MPHHDEDKHKELLEKMDEQGKSLDKSTNEALKDASVRDK